MAQHSKGVKPPSYFHHPWSTLPSCAAMTGLGYSADMAVAPQTRLPEGFPNLGLLLFLFIFHSMHSVSSV